MSSTFQLFSVCTLSKRLETFINPFAHLSLLPALLFFVLLHRHDQILLLSNNILIIAWFNESQHSGELLTLFPFQTD